MPEGRLAVELCQVRAEARAAPPGARRLQVVDQGRDVECRVDVHQQMDVVFLPAELEQLATPCGEDFSEGLAQIVEQFYRQRLSSVLRHKNYV